MSINSDFLSNLPKFLSGSLFAIFNLFYSPLFSQEQRLARLPSCLNEVSGIEVINDSLILAINDSGNAPDLHVLSINGDYQRAIKVTNARNVDWEDLTYDATNNLLYISDLGNNLNKRKNLCLYELSLNDLSTDTITARKIPIHFPNQEAFPPVDSLKRFDCEAITYHNGGLYIATKCGDKPFTGTFFLYRYDLQTKQTTLCQTSSLGTSGWLRHSITAMDSEGNHLYISTYAGIYEFELNTNHTLSFLKSRDYRRITQKESISIYKNHLYIADEKSPLFLGPNLYKMKTQ